MYDIEPGGALGRLPMLVVDDSRAQRRLLTRTLSKWGYESIEAESGEEAMEICQENNIDFVISDWMMPGMSGVEFCRAFRDLAGARPAYFILLTAQTEREALAEGLESGADDFLSKPFHSVELKARLTAGERVIRAQRDLSEKNDALQTTYRELADAYTAIERDLKGARVFQQGLVPERFIRTGDIDISMLFEPSGHVGGDLVGYFPINDDEIGVFSADVSGHGVASALMTARIAGYLSDGAPDRNISLRKTDDGYQMIPLKDVCRRLNAMLQSDAESDQYLTLSIARVHTGTGRVSICQAGHPSPAVQRANGEIEYLELFGTPLGLVDEGDYSETELTLEPGDRLMLYSDGLTECPDPDDALLDEEGLATLLQSHGKLAGLDLVGALRKDLAKYRGSEDFPDDLSAVLIERR